MGGIWPLVIMLVLLVGMFYFFLVRPMRQREKKHDEMVSELEKGDQVITAGGMYGVVEKIDDNSIVLKVESGAMIRVTKGGVISKPEL
ncbi:MAG: preprotein translocase subunit YajC [Dehalococcoidales bacterium]|nr:MAG: preprotein translocase subunit YajC [Dehalococcoidales bacterium]